MEEEPNNIRVVQSNIEAQLSNFERTPDAIFVKTSYICDNLRDHILDSEDEPHLSKTQNYHRRIFIASELFLHFCDIYAHVVDHEYAKIVRDLVQWEKFKRISRKITSEKLLELRREKYFIKEAQAKLLKSLEDTRVEEETQDLTQIPTARGERDTEVESFARPNRETGVEEVNAHEVTPGEEINHTLAPPLVVSSFRSELASEVTDNITEIREVVANATQLDLPITSITRQHLSLPNMNAELSIGEPTVQQQAAEDENIDRLLKILEDELFPNEATEVQQPENLAEPTRKSSASVLEETPEIQKPENLVQPTRKSPEHVLEETPEIQQPENVVQPTRKSPEHVLEETPEIQKPENLVQPTRKSPEHVLEETPEIQQPENVAEPTRKSPEHVLEETPEVQQPENVAEPTRKSPEPVLEGTACENRLTTEMDDREALQSSEDWSLPSLETVDKTRTKHLIIDREIIIHDYAARAMRLNRNINIKRVQVFEGPPRVLRAISASHLMTTPGYNNTLFRSLRSSKLSTLYNRHLETEQKPVEEIHQQRRTEERIEVDMSKVTTNAEVMEEVGMRAGMHSRLEKSDGLIDVPEKSRPPDLDLTLAGAQVNESLLGVPMSRIVNLTAEPPEGSQMERINAAPIVPTPRVQQLQGKSIDPRTSPPWFISTKENPPNEKYRKFSYVYDKLQMYWSMLENQGEEKRITIREFLSFESDVSVADYLTVLRIVDKMSIQRKLLLEYVRDDVVVRPFEIPYVSDAQLLLKEKERVL